ncbi:hypothetical protein AB0F36_36025 [Streptomyces sp. NPDC029080]|uniref:hypothetical protein n=1 Tax=Streptomyces sp. NPDC029080 TaxID=3155017 RepID=UPI00144CF535|nr:hypothetical protein [Streptomyces sp. SID2955]
MTEYRTASDRAASPAIDLILLFGGVWPASTRTRSAGELSARWKADRAIAPSTLRTRRRPTSRTHGMSHVR